MNTAQVIAVSVGSGLVTGLLVKLTYGLIENDWPERYVYRLGVIERLRIRNLRSYLMLKTLPLALFLFLDVATLVQLGLPTGVSALGAVVTFVLLSDVRAIIVAYRNRDSRRGTLFVYYVFSIIFSFAIASVAHFLGRKYSFLAPTPHELVSNLWVVLFVTVAGFGVKKGVGFPQSGEREKVALARKDVGEYVWREIGVHAKEYGVSSEVAQAIVVVEVLQRPHWFRVLERVLGRFRKCATYGVAQMLSASPLSDIESLDKLCKEMSESVSKDARDGLLNVCNASKESCEAKRRQWDLYERYVSARGATRGYVGEVASVYYQLTMYQGHLPICDQES